MADPSDDLMLSTLGDLRREVTAFQSDIQGRLDKLDGRLDRLAQHFDILTVRLDDGFADLRVATRAAGNLAIASDQETHDLKARIVALEPKVAQLEGQT